MGKHLTDVLVRRIEKWAKEKGATPMGVMSKVSAEQKRKGAPPISESAIRRVLRGESFQRGRVERRGAPKKLTKKVIKACEKSRVKLLKKANSVDEYGSLIVRRSVLYLG